MLTNTSPSIYDSPASNFPAESTAQGGLGRIAEGIGDLLLDYGRWKLIDSERWSDARNIPDSVDVRTGQAYVDYSPGGAASQGSSPWPWVALAVAAGAGAVMLAGALRG